jgi:hypothetical protein
MNKVTRIGRYDQRGLRAILNPIGETLDPLLHHRPEEGIVHEGRSPGVWLGQEGSQDHGRGHAAIRRKTAFLRR